MRQFQLYVACLIGSAFALFSAPMFATAGEFEEISVLQKQVRELIGAGRYPQAEPLARKMMAIVERSFANRPQIMASALCDLATTLNYQAKFKEAVPLYERSIKIQEAAFGVEYPDLSAGLCCLGNTFVSLGRYGDAEPLYLRALAITEKASGPQHPDVSDVLVNLGSLYGELGRYVEAEKLLNRSLSIDEKAYGDQDGRVADILNNLALLLIGQGRYVETQPLCIRALQIKEKSHGTEHPIVATSLNTLANVDYYQGHYSQAEPLYRRAIRIRERALGEQHADLASTLNNLATLLAAESRYDEAEPIAKRALAIDVKTFGEKHPSVAVSRSNLGNLYYQQKRYADAKPLYDSALAIREQVFGKQHHELVYTLFGLANLYDALNRETDAESAYKRALTISETSLGEQHPKVATCLQGLAFFYRKRGRDAEADNLIDRAISIRERVGAAPIDRFHCYLLRSRISWKLNRKNEALLDLRQALDLAEQVRNQSSGADIERAESFSQFASAFEQMAAWQFELGDASEAFLVIERGRARSLLDEMNRVGSNLNVGRSAGERKAVQENESQLKARVAQFEKQLELAPEAKKEVLNLALTQARKELYEQYRDERNNSPVYRNLLSTGSGPPRVSQLQRTLLSNDGLALIYLFGKEAGYVIILDSQRVRMAALSLDETHAKLLGTSAGALTNDLLQEILIGKDSLGIVPQLATPPTDTKPDDLKRLTARLSALWQILIPESERDALTSGKCRRLIVVPDGPLALFPFESLVVQGEQDPEYLLDRGPSILYGPSLSVLYNLSGRSKTPQGTSNLVLTVADPVYPQETQLASAQGSGLIELASRTRYAGVGGHLNRLPYTAEESTVVKDAFTKVGLVASSLMREQATEANLRQSVAGRKIVHLACHGLTDQAHGNFFGALALTPGKQAQTDSADDGYLTLPEIYELDMKGCELAILSACQTNYGPQQHGEGVWALSRGFLVGGARRVVASNWLVNDEAGARLIQYYCTALADDEKQSRPADYAKQLQAAKKWVRSQPNWKHPYFWSTFVLVGPQ